MKKLTILIIYLFTINISYAEYKNIDRTEILIVESISLNILTRYGRIIPNDKALKAYDDFVSPNRYLSESEKNAGFLTFGKQTINLSIGQQVKEVVARSKTNGWCDRAISCEQAAKSWWYQMLGANAIFASRKELSSKRNELIAMGTLISTIYKNDERNRGFGMYEPTIGLVEQAINDIVAQPRKPKNTMELYLSMTEEEKVATLIGIMSVGTLGGYKFLQKVCKNGGCDSLGDPVFNAQLEKDKGCKNAKESCEKSCNVYSPSVAPGEELTNQIIAEILLGRSPRSVCKDECKKVYKCN